ncbi:hypothetical protein [Hwanghaeella sp.]|uniref:hypothetical protein n=1 Tax=Hwanghaeella sp. TaxID=2605943 RepID=UPI003CCB74AF
MRDQKENKKTRRFRLKIFDGVHDVSPSSRVPRLLEVDLVSDVTRAGSHPPATTALNTSHAPAARNSPTGGSRPGKEATTILSQRPVRSITPPASPIVAIAWIKRVCGGNSTATEAPGDTGARTAIAVKAAVQQVANTNAGMNFPKATALPSSYYRRNI